MLDIVLVLLGKDDLHPARPPAGSPKPTFHVVPEVPSDTHRAWFDRGTVSTGYGGPGRVTAGRTASGSPRSLSLSPDPPNYADCAQRGNRNMEFEVERDGGWEETTEDSLGRMSGEGGRLGCAGRNLPGPPRVSSSTRVRAVLALHRHST